MGNPKKLLSVLSLVVCCVMGTSLVFAAETATEDKDKTDKPKVESKEEKTETKTDEQKDPSQMTREERREMWRNRRGDRQQNFDPEQIRNQMQERMLEMAKQYLDVTEEEWSVIKPRLAKVMSFSDSNNGMANVMRSMFRRNMGQPTKPPTEPVQLATEELYDTLEKEAPTTAEIKAKLAALRGAREKNRQELIKAQQELKEILTLKQEAMLVMAGLLE